MIPRKRPVYVKAMESLRSKPLDVNGLTVKAFLKKEKVDFTLKDGAPRLIQPMPPEYIMECGVYIKRIEKPLIKAIEEDMDIYITKGRSWVEVGQFFHKAWSSYKNPVSLDLDVSRFDQHVSDEALKMEFKVYNEIWKSPWLKKLLNAQRKARCRVMIPGEGTVIYKLQHGRLSGVPNTGIGNIIIMCVLLRRFCDSYEIKCHVIDNGDDCNLIMEESTARRARRFITDFFLEHGFTLKVEGIGKRLESVVHCRASPCLMSAGWRMVRRPEDVVNKDVVSVKSIRSKDDWDFYRRAVSDCGMFEFRGIAVAYPFLKMVGRGAALVAPTAQRFSDAPWRMQDWATKNQNVLPGTEAVDPLSRVWVGMQTGLLCEEQIALEKRCDSYTPEWVEMSNDHTETVGRLRYLAVCESERKLWSLGRIW